MKAVFRRSWTIGLAVFCLFAGGSAQAASVEWNYDDATGKGPSFWGSLTDDHGDLAFPDCNGSAQTPVNLRPGDYSGFPHLRFHYGPVELTVENNGHTVEVLYEGAGSTLKVDGKEYELLQFHFHTPSEHARYGHRFPIEGHLVHRGEDGELAVVGVLFRKGRPNHVLQAALDHAPFEDGHYVEGENEVHGVEVEAEGLLPDDRDLYAYEGSLTTPPCSEGVRWFVMKEPMTASREQIRKLGEILADVAHGISVNARPLQPLNGRTIVEKISGGCGH